MGQSTDEREIAMAGNLFPPLSNDSPVAFGDGISVKRYVTPVSAIKGNGTSTYEPLSSVWEGSDGTLLEEMFKFYATIPPEPILDATFNAGRFWKGSKRRIVSMDIDPQYEPMIVGDNRKMTGVKSSQFGVVVYDPPHVGPQGRDKSRKRFDVDFGATVECGKEHDWNLSYLYPPFLRQAKRVLKPHGLLLAKITDMVNNHKSKWPHCDFMRMAEEAGFIVCDLIVKVRTGPMVSTKWKEAHHARKRHCFWIICRNSDECERRGMSTLLCKRPGFVFGDGCAREGGNFPFPRSAIFEKVCGS